MLVPERRSRNLGSRAKNLELQGAQLCRGVSHIKVLGIPPYPRQLTARTESGYEYASCILLRDASVRGSVARKFSSFQFYLPRHCDLRRRINSANTDHLSFLFFAR